MIARILAGHSPEEMAAGEKGRKVKLNIKKGIPGEGKALTFQLLA